MGDQRATLSSSSLVKAPTVPEEDFATLIQSRRRAGSGALGSKESLQFKKP